MSFIHYVGLSSKVLDILPTEILIKLDSYWKNKEKSVSKHSNDAKIYKKFAKNLGKEWYFIFLLYSQYININVLENRFNFIREAERFHYLKHISHFHFYLNSKKYVLNISFE